MRFWDTILPLTLLGVGPSLVNSFPTAEHLAKLTGSSTAGQKRCPFADLQAQVKEKLDKRLLVDPMTKPIDSECASTTRSNIAAKKDPFFSPWGA